MEDKVVPPVPFEKKTAKYGVVTVLEIERNDKGGLAYIQEGDHQPFWVRAKMVLGFDVY